MSFPNHKLIANLPSEEETPQIEDDAVIQTLKKAPLYALARKWGVVSVDGVSVSALDVATLKIAVIKAQAGDCEGAPEKMTKADLVKKVLAKHPGLPGVNAMNKDTLLLHLQRDAEDVEKKVAVVEDEELLNKKLFETNSRSMTCQIMKKLLIKKEVPAEAFKGVTKPGLQEMIMEHYKWDEPKTPAREEKKADVLPYPTWFQFLLSQGFTAGQFVAASEEIKMELFEEYTRVKVEALEEAAAQE
jgi:hypothetical protein